MIEPKFSLSTTLKINNEIQTITAIIYDYENQKYNYSNGRRYLTQQEIEQAIILELGKEKLPYQLGDKVGIYTIIGLSKGTEIYYTVDIPEEPFPCEETLSFTEKELKNLY